MGIRYNILPNKVNLNLDDKINKLSKQIKEFIQK